MKTIHVPWSDPGSGFTALFEALVIDWLQAANTSAVSRLLGLTWDEVDGIKQRAVARGLARRELTVPEDIGVDETSFQKRHEYVTVVADTRANVIHWVSDGRGKESLSSHFECFEVADLQQVRSITMGFFHRSRRESAARTTRYTRATLSNNRRDRTSTGYSEYHPHIVPSS